MSGPFAGAPGRQPPCLGCYRRCLDAGTPQPERCRTSSAGKAEQLPVRGSLRCRCRCRRAALRRIPRLSSIARREHCRSGRRTRHKPGRRTQRVGSPPRGVASEASRRQNSMSGSASSPSEPVRYNLRLTRRVAREVQQAWEHFAESYGRFFDLHRTFLSGASSTAFPSCMTRYAPGFSCVAVFQTALPSGA